MNRDYAEDCIHLKACRRLCKYHNINNRGCRKDYCTAYESRFDFIRMEDAIEEAFYIGDEYCGKDLRDYPIRSIFKDKAAKN